MLLWLLALLNVFGIINAAYLYRQYQQYVSYGRKMTCPLGWYCAEVVGQAFADEIFRVWKARHNNIEIKHQNANRNVEFMIKRALSMV